MGRESNDDAPGSPDRGERRPGLAERPPVSVVVPFHGGLAAAREVTDALTSLIRGTDDELIVADNTPGGVFGQTAPGAGITVVAAHGERSPAHARNAGSDGARHAWLLFVDADCSPDPMLIERYFDGSIAEDVGAVAGRIDSAESASLLGRHARSRRLLGQEANLGHTFKPFAVTANLLVRREAWESIGGFYEGVRAGEDNDFCWRMQEDGWRLEYRDGAAVRHMHKETIRAFLRQQMGYGAGRAWLDRHHRGSEPRPRVGTRLARCVAGVIVWTALLRFERAAFKAVDAAVILAEGIGYLRENKPVRDHSPDVGAADVAIVADRFPDPLVVGRAHTLAASGLSVVVEAVRRGQRADRAADLAVAVRYLEDDGIMRRWVDAASLAWRHPLLCANDLLSRPRAEGDECTLSLRELAPSVRRIRRQDANSVEAGAAGVASRVGRLAGLPRTVRAPERDSSAGFRTGP